MLKLEKPKRAQSLPIYFKEREFYVVGHLVHEVLGFHLHPIVKGIILARHRCLYDEESRKKIDEYLYDYMKRHGVDLDEDNPFEDFLKKVYGDDDSA